jgi:hypothetical protein
MKSLGTPSCKQELLIRLVRVGPGTPRQWGLMTAPQMICHLSDCFLGVMGDKDFEIPKGFSILSIFKP